MAQPSHPSVRDPVTPRPWQQALLAVIGEASAVRKGFQPLCHSFAIHGLCRARLSREPWAHG